MIFLDTSVLVSYLVEGDSNHPRAKVSVNEIISGKHGSAVTSDYVFDEMVTVVLVRSKFLDTAATVGELIKESIAMIRIDERIFENSWMVFNTVSGKSHILQWWDETEQIYLYIITTSV